MSLKFFVEHPRYSVICSIFILIFGTLSIPFLPVAQYPDIAPPQITVSANYPGANSKIVESSVTNPLEQEINGVEGMRYITSKSNNDGTCSIDIIFEQNRNLDAAMLDVQNRVQLAQSKLPQEVKAMGVNIEKSSKSMVVAYSLFAKNNEYDTTFVSNYADRFLKDSLKRIKGVGLVQIIGERKFAMRLWLDPNKLASRNLTPNDVVKALKEQNIQVAAGQIGQPPINHNQSIQMSVQAQGRLKTAEDFENLVIKTGSNKGLVYFKDIGRAELGAEDYSSTFRLMDNNAVNIRVYQLPDANALEVRDSVKKQMEQFKKGLPPNVECIEVMDTTEVISESIKEVLITLGFSILLVVAVIFAFLQNWKTTFIPVLTIPVSLIGTFTFLKIFGFSINTLSLFGIVLATGLVVDDAIVVIENIERFVREKGMHVKEASIEALKEVFSAVIATSLVLVAVFLPIAFFPGASGQLYKQFAITMAISISISLFVAITLTPALSALLLGEKNKENKLFTKMNMFIQKAKEFYEKNLIFSINHIKGSLVIFCLLLILTFGLSKILPTGFIPNEDQGYFITMVQAPEGTSLEKTDKIATKLIEYYKKLPETMYVFSVGGHGPMGKAPNKAMVFVKLKPINERKGVEHCAKSIVHRVQKDIGFMSGAIIMAFEPSPIQGAGSIGGFQFEIKDEANHSLNDLSTIARTFMKEAKKEKAIGGLFSEFSANDPQLSVEVDRFKAKQLNVPLNEIYSTMQILLGSMYVNDFDYLNKLYRVYLQADNQFRTEPDNIGQFYVRADSGVMIPLGSLIKVTPSYTSQLIPHYNLLRAVELKGSPAPGYTTGQAIAAIEKTAKKVLPKGITYEWSGTSLEEVESGSKAIFIFVLSFIFVFLILAAQYESFTSPLIILLSVPMAIFGALLSQLLRGMQNDVFCQIGLVMLVGISCKNAILIVEFADQLRKKGLDIKTAAIQAAITRFRPILMTSFAFILGILPLVLSSGVGSLSRQSMGTAVFGGMLISTILNLFVIPVFYVLINTIKQNRKELKEKIFAKIKRNEEIYGQK